MLMPLYPSRTILRPGNCWVKLRRRLDSWWCPSVNFFKFQPCDHTLPGTQRLMISHKVLMETKRRMLTSLQPIDRWTHSSYKYSYLALLLLLLRFLSRGSFQIHVYLYMYNHQLNNELFYFSFLLLFRTTFDCCFWTIFSFDALPLPHRFPNYLLFYILRFYVALLYVALFCFSIDWLLALLAS